MKVPTPEKLKSGNWRIQYSQDGKRRSKTFTTEGEAIAYAAAIKGGVLRPGEKNTSVTLRTASEQYLSDRKEVMSPSTIANYQSYLRTRFQSVMDRPAASVNWQRAISEETKNCSAKTIRNAWGLFAPALKEYGITPEVKLPPVVKKEKAWLDPAQIKTFVSAVRGKSFEIPALLALMGLRRSEILGLTWDNIDLGKNLIRIHGSVVYDENYNFVRKETNKTATSRRIVPIMIPRLSEILAAVDDKTGPIMRFNPTTLYSQINDLCRANGLPLVGVHGLRHSFASLGYHLKMSEMEVMRLGGWSDYTTVRKIYTHLAEEDYANASNNMTKFFENL